MRSKTNSKLYARFFPRFERVILLVIAWNLDWFIVLFSPVVIGRSHYFGNGFSAFVNLKTALAAEE